ncbi:MAG: hypothetical protein K0S30_999 [Clostridia bacterium]|jgi:dTDP-4-amino-4,6-dideoxygalactose transaminase|nr:hypothetical protein [Clostridia bacterium]
MAGYIKPIGGEFWFEDDILNDYINNFNETNTILLYGGQSAIEFILQDIELKEDEWILLPSYLCPTILYKFKNKNVNTLFYEINEDLSINIKSISKLIRKFNVQALFFIDYFGFYHNKQTLDYLKRLKDKGILLIEDAVQMLWFSRKSRFIGDYIFNSYRKFFPSDGSIVLLSEKQHLEYKIIEDNYNNLILEARVKKTQYVKNHTGKEEDFLNKFVEADEWYYKREDINGIDERSKEFLSHVDYEKIKEQRIENYNYLYDRLIENNKVKILFDKEKIEDNVPLAFPVLINHRDVVRKELRVFNIYCPVHWDITREEWSENFPKSIKISKSILSIPIDWRYSKKDMDYLIYKFNGILID